MSRARKLVEAAVRGTIREARADLVAQRLVHAKLVDVLEMPVGAVLKFSTSRGEFILELGDDGRWSSDAG